MQSEDLRPLLAPGNHKIVLLVMDGLGGLPMEPGGKTELETAVTPNMNRLATEGILGQSCPLDPGITPGSGPAHLSLFGIDPICTEVGRGVLEAFGVMVPVNKGDVAARGNFCTLDSNGLIIDRRAGRITSEEVAPICEKLKAIKLPGVEVEFKLVKEYRFVLVLRGAGLSPDLDETDPQRIGAAPMKVVAQNGAADKAASLFNQWIEEANKIIKDEPKANGLTLRGFATDPGLPTYKELYDLRAACVAVYPMYRGVARLVGMDLIQFDGESPSDEFKAVADHWNEYDFFFVHIKKTDSYGEDGNFDGKVKVIEGVDAALPSLLALNPDVLIITGDHSTPAKLRTHTWHPVPYLLWAPASVRPDMETEFGERACMRGGLGVFSALDNMPLALAHALRMNRFGA
jgi:2,3-bisphosphoglycerate-independent phosphoglycerate mutase